MDPISYYKKVGYNNNERKLNLEEIVKYITFVKSSALECSLKSCISFSCDIGGHHDS